ncbi:MAG: tRNA lysidine(34) synthetase TilS [Eubacteriales bacterium]
MIYKVISTIERYQMLKKGATVIVALSGGADSMALISILKSINDDFGIKIIAAHVNHGLRGTESMRDEKFVIDYCQYTGIELRVLNKNIKEIAENLGEGLEECGRRIRYEFFNSISSDAVIATAHSLSDSMETMLFNLSRGSTLKGLCGIPPVRDNIIRPLIECSRTEIEEYCKQNDIEYVLDSSNFEDVYMRNHIRHNIIPQLKKINPLLDEAFYRCLISINEDEELLEELSSKLLAQATTEGGYNVEILLRSHIALRKRVIASILLAQTGTAAQNKHVQAVEELLLHGGNIQIQKATAVSVKSRVLSFPRKNKLISPWRADFIEGIIELPFKTIEIKIVNRKDLENIQNIHKNILDYCFDYDKIYRIAEIRSRCDGDKIRLKKSNCTKTIKKLFNEKRIPVEDRNKVIIISDGEGLLWIDGFGCADRCGINDETSRVCIIYMGGTINA